MIIVSACLAGINCTHKKSNNLNRYIRRLVDAGAALPVCPEELGGLPTPRESAEITVGDGRDVLLAGSRLLTRSGRDVTKNYIAGAKAALGIARRCRARLAVLKANSPSCGSRRIYDGTFTRTLKAGVGVTAALFLKNGILVVDDRCL
jgi:uncharacterized protein YbbK (DUF523 family)